MTTPRTRLYACIEGARFGLSPREVLGESRCVPNVAARWAVMRRLRADGFSVSAIGRMTNRDHSSVLYALGMLRKA